MVAQNVWLVLIVETRMIGPYNPWLYTFIAKTPEIALNYVANFFGRYPDDLMTLQNYRHHIPDSYYCRIEERIVDDETGDEEDGMVDGPDDS